MSGLKQKIDMTKIQKQIRSLFLVAGVSIAVNLGAVQSGGASSALLDMSNFEFDLNVLNVLDDTTKGDETKSNETTLDVISVNKIAKAGLAALKNKDYQEAVSAFEIATKHGHNGARWQLGQLYKKGIGVEKNDYKAFQLFLDIARQYKEYGFERVSKRQVSGAFASLAQYLKNGIPDSPVKINILEANRLFHASAYFGNAQAQFELGEYYATHPVEKPNYVQAARWLVKANQKGHPKAAALLGKLMFEGHGVEHSPEFGLALATSAMMRARREDKPWVEAIYTELYGTADEHQRNVATAILEQNLLRTRTIKLRRQSNQQVAGKKKNKTSTRIELRLGLKKAKRQNKPDINELIFNNVLKNNSK